MAQSTEFVGNILRYFGSSADDDDTVIETTEVAVEYRHFQLSSTAGAMDVFVSLNGTDYTTAALSLIDMGATTNDPVIVTAADRMYEFHGTFVKIKVLQNGATAVADAVLIGSK